MPTSKKKKKTKSKALVKHSFGGRPTKKDDESVKKLESIFKIGGTVEEACSYAGISKPTYYEWVKKDVDFLTKMKAAQYYADIAAKNIVIKSITQDKDINTAKWWLEKRQFKDNVGTQINIQGENQKVAYITFQKDDSETAPDTVRGGDRQS